MKKLYLLPLIFFSLFINTQAQEGHFFALDYKVGNTRLSHAYNTYIKSSTKPQQSDFTFYADAFIQKNLAFYYGYQTEGFYFRTNVEGLFNWVLYEYNRDGHLKSSFRRLKKVQSENAFISLPEKGESGYIGHPVNGGADYKMINTDILFGSENLKIGANLGVGMLGATMNSGLGIRGFNKAPEISTLSLGYYQIGLKAMMSNFKDLPLSGSVGLNRFRGFNSLVGPPLTKEERRGGFGIDIEAKYFIGDNQLKPYVSFYTEIRKFTKETATTSYTSGSSTQYVDLEIPALRTFSLGITFGCLLWIEP